MNRHGAKITSLLPRFDCQHEWDCAPRTLPGLLHRGVHLHEYKAHLLRVLADEIGDFNWQPPDHSSKFHALEHVVLSKYTARDTLPDVFAADCAGRGQASSVTVLKRLGQSQYKNGQIKSKTSALSLCVGTRWKRAFAGRMQREQERAFKACESFLSRSKQAAESVNTSQNRTWGACVVLAVYILCVLSLLRVSSFAAVVLLTRVAVTVTDTFRISARGTLLDVPSSSS
eukprot:1343015-Rhodomonas_salina.3